MSEDAAPLEGRELLLIVGGGIAAYKSATLVRELQRAGARVQTVLTAAGARFISPVTFAGLTGRSARMDLWDPSHPGELHIDLTAQAQLLVVAPATADLLARASLGLADDLATTCLAAWEGPLVLAPAMHPRMWRQPATQEHIARLRARGAVVVGPVDGPLASGESGLGRMVEPEALALAVARALAPPTKDLEGRRVLITAGPTHEPVDPVRFVGNRSSGRMGFALASRAHDRGATVTLITGPVSLHPPEGVRTVRVRTAQELFDATVPEAPHQDIVVMAAAVADYRPAEVAAEKIKKTQGELVLRLVKNPDVLAELGARRGDKALPVLVGFAVESTHLVAHAREKLARKRCDLVVANLAQDGFEGTDNLVTLVQKDADEALPRMPKTQVADRILDTANALWTARHGT